MHVMVHVPDLVKVVANPTVPVVRVAVEVPVPAVVGQDAEAAVLAIVMVPVVLVVLAGALGDAAVAVPVDAPATVVPLPVEDPAVLVLAMEHVQLSATATVLAAVRMAAGMVVPDVQLVLVLALDPATMDALLPMPVLSMQT